MSLRPTRRARLRRLLAIVMGTATLVPSAACGILGGGNDVMLLGDSLTVLVADEVTQSAKPDHTVDVSATWGLRIDEELDPAAKIASEDPAQVIINLGTNNILQHHDTTASAEDLSTMLDLLDGIRCVHVVTINEHINRLGENLGPAAAALNAQIRQLAARRLNVHVIDWNKIVTENLGNNILDPDTVHPNPEGVRLLTRAYLDAISSC